MVWLYGNYTSNSSRQNVPVNFDFLDNPAQFEPITYTDLRKWYYGAHKPAAEYPE